MYLPAVIPPFEDELLYSYLLRLAEANGFDDIPLFLKFYVNDCRGLKKPTIKYYSEEPLNGLVKYLHPVLNPDGTQTDFLSFYLDHSMARFFHSYSGSYAARRILEQQFVTDSRSSSSMRYGLRNRPVLSFCPECMAEDRAKHGRHYIHRLHQVPYAHICPIHHCRLLYFAGNPGRELTETRFRETLILPGRYSAAFAKMCSELFQFNHDLDCEFNLYYFQWWQYSKWINIISNILTDEMVLPYQEECRTGKKTPRTDTLLLYLLCAYISHEENLSSILRHKPSEIPIIKKRIEKAAVS